MAKRALTRKLVQSPELKATKHLLNAVRKLTQAVQDQRADIADLRALLDAQTHYGDLR